MDYEVKVTSEAEADFDKILYYLVKMKLNSQAAKHFIADFEKTKQALSEVAGSLKLCDNPQLKRLGYHRMNFPSMDYFMLYRIEGKTVIIDNIFHKLQDFENKIR